MEFPHPIRERRERQINTRIMDAALVGASEIIDSRADENPGPYPLPLGVVPPGIEAGNYAELLGARVEELLGALGCHDVEVDRYITEFTRRIKPRRPFVPIHRPDTQGPRIMFRQKAFDATS